MEAILFPEEENSRTSHEDLMAGLVVSRSRKTRDPSTFLRWSLSPHSNAPSILSSSPTVNHATTTTINYSNVNSSRGLPRSTSLPNRFNEEQDSAVRGTSASNRASATVTPPQVHRKKSYYEQCGALNYGPVFEEDQPRARAAAVKKITKGDKVNEQGRKSEKKQPGVKNNVQHELWRTSSSPISTGSGNRGRIARTGSGYVSCSTPEDEKYAGPGYSKSPPPCSLPFPKFSVNQPGRTFSASDSGVSSSTTALPGGSSSSSGMSSGLQSPSKQVSCNCWDATKDLKRILNLDQQVAT